MRLLERNDHDELSLTNDFGEKDIPRYAILSHTWGADTEEVTYREMMDGTGECKAGYEKIRLCGQLAKRDRIQYFWVDTCCIDKSNNTELAEAINSMFRWYQNAAKCYVYMSDVTIENCGQSDKIFQGDLEQAFRESRWFTRGWTLQELIAPPSVEFFSKGGEKFGDKKLFERQLQEITGIALQALQGIPLSEFSVDERMSWAKTRVTTREEDNAYCLLGIFDIFMPLIYGEGKPNALSRLRRKIDKRIGEQAQPGNDGYAIAFYHLHSSSKLTLFIDTQHSALQRWLSPSNVQDDLVRHCCKLMVSSCDPLFLSPQFTSWEAGTSSSILRVGRYAGAGKTSFASAACERLQKSEGKVAYFFCKSGSKSMGSTIAVLRTLLSQILKLEKPAYDILLPIYHENGQMSADSISEIEHMFTVLLESGLPVLHLIVDAVDELTDRPPLFQALQSFVCQSSTVVKILVTGRNESDITESFASYPNLQITPKMTETPIQRYLTKRLSEWHTLHDQSLKRAIFEGANCSAEGLWLYAKLMIDAVTELPSIRAIERQLQQLPAGLPEMYFQILERHADRLLPWQFEWAQQLFLWVDTEDYYWLLGKGQMQSVDTSVLSVIFQAVNVDGDPPIDPLGVAKILGGPMMETKIKEVDGQGGINYIHPSAKQYIMSDSNTQASSRLPRLLKPRRLRQLYRGRTALWYFESSSACRNLVVYRQWPDAACDVWWDTPHPVMVYGLWDALTLGSLPDVLDGDELMMAQFLCELLIQFLTTDRCLVWVESAIIVNYSGHWPNLLGNALKVLEALSSSPISGYEFFERYLQARWDFFWHFSHVLAATSPKDMFVESPIFKRTFSGSRFSMSSVPLPVYKQVSAIGEQYKYLAEEF
jgi:hypothetical protein